MLLLVLLLSLLLCLLSLAGIAWIIIVGSLFSIDGLFMSLILLTLAGIFFLNVLIELRDHSSAGKDKGAASKVPSAPTAE